MSELGFLYLFLLRTSFLAMLDSKPIVSSTTNIFDLSRMISKSGRISSPVIMLGELKFVTSAYNSRANRLRKVAI